MLAKFVNFHGSPKSQTRKNREFVYLSMLGMGSMVSKLVGLHDYGYYYSVVS